MSGTSVRAQLKPFILEDRKRNDPLFSGRYTDIRVSGVRGSEAFYFGS